MCSLVLQALKKDHYDHDQNPNHIPVEISLQEDSVSVADAFSDPGTVMAEPFAAKIAHLAVVNCVVNQRTADRALALLFALALLRRADGFLACLRLRLSVP